MIYLRARKMERMEWNMDVRPGDILTMKKPHPCGGNKFEVMYVGIDLRIKCLKCGSQMRIDLEWTLSCSVPSAAESSWCHEIK